MVIGEMEIRLRADMAQLTRDMETARRVTGDSMGSMSTSMVQVRSQIDAMAEAEKSRASIFSRGFSDSTRLLGDTKDAADSAAKSLAEIKINPDALKISEASFSDLQTWQEKSAYAIGAGVGAGVVTAQSALEKFEDFAKTKLIITGAAVATGVAAAAFTAIYAAYKATDFAVGLLTGESYKSVNIDALVAANGQLSDLQQNFRLTANEASGLAATLSSLGVSHADYIAGFKQAAAAMRSNTDQMDALGVAYKDAEGKLLPLEGVLTNVSDKLDEYSAGWERNAVAVMLGFTSSAQVGAALSVTAEKLAAVTERQRAYGLLIGSAQQEEIARYKSAMSEFNVELENTSEGFKRAIADNIMPALTNLAEWFKDGWPTVVQGFRGGMAAFTSLFYGLKMAVDIVAEGVAAGFKVLQSAFGGVIGGIGALVRGDFSGVMDAFVGAYERARDRMSKVGDNIVEYARSNVAAMKLAWGGQIFPDEPAAKPEVKKTAEEAKDVIKSAEAYKGLMRAVNEKIAAQNLEIQTSAKLTEGQRLAVAFTTELANGTSKLTDEQKTAYKAELETLIAREKINLGKQEDRKKDEEDAGKSAAANKKELEAYAGLIASIKEKTAANKLEAALGVNATESQKVGIKLDQELASGKVKLSDGHLMAARAAIVEQGASENLLKTRQAEKDVQVWIEQSTIARKASSAALAAEYAMYGKSSDARDSAMIAIKSETELEKFLAAARAASKPISEEMVAQMRREKDMRDQVEQATLGQTKALGYAAQLSDENKKFAAESIFDEKDRAAAILKIDADMWQERIKLAGDGTEAQRLLQERYTTWYQNQLAKPQIEANKKLWESIDSTAHDTFVNIFNGGKNAFDRLRDTLKSGLLDLLYQMTVKKWIFQIGASVTGSAGIAGTAQAAGPGGSGAGGTMGALNIASTAKSAYSAMSMGYAGMIDAGGTGIAAMGATFGSSAVSAFGAGFASNTAAGVMTASETFAGAGMAAEASAASLGASVAAAIPYVAAAIAVAYVLKKGFGHGDRETTSQGIEGSFGGGGFAGNKFNNWKEEGGWFTGDNNGHDTSGIDAATQRQFTGGFDALKSVSADFARSLGLSASSITGYSKQISLALTGDATKDAAAITALFTGMGEDMAKSALSGYSSVLRDGETYASSLQRLSVSLSAVNGMFDTLNVRLLDTSVYGADMASKFVDLFGGLDKMQSISAGYFQSYYNEQEKVDIATRQLQQSFRALGFELPANNAALRAQIEAQSMTTYAGRAARAELMVLSASFAQLTSASDQLAASANSAAQAAAAEATAKDQAAAAEATAKAQAAAGKAAAQAAAAIEKAKSLASSRDDLNIKLMEASGNAAGALAARRQAELAAMDESLRPMQRYINLLGDEAAARDSAIKAETDRISALVANGRAVRDFLDGLKTSVTAATSTASRLAAAKSDFGADLRGARKGNAEAFAGLPASAKAYMDAGAAANATTAQQRILMAQIGAKLSALTPVAELNQNTRYLEQIKTATTTTAGYMALLTAEQQRANKERYDAKARAYSAAHDPLVSARSSAMSALGSGVTAANVGDKVAALNASSTAKLSGAAAGISRDPGMLKSIAELEAAGKAPVLSEAKYASTREAFVKGIAAQEAMWGPHGANPFQYRRLAELEAWHKESVKYTSAQAKIKAYRAANTALRAFDASGAAPGVYDSTQMYATGAAFTNGVATRPTGFHNSMMGEAGPEAIMPLANIGGSLGVRVMGSGANMARLEALVEKLTAEVVSLRHEARATAQHTAKTESHARKTKDLMEKFDIEGMPTTEVA